MNEIEKAIDEWINLFQPNTSDVSEEDLKERLNKVAIPIEEFRQFNGSVKTKEDVLDHIKRLQQCTKCRRSFYDKWCPSCMIPKDVLRERVDKLFTFDKRDVSDCKLTIHKERLLKDLLGDEKMKLTKMTTPQARNYQCNKCKIILKNGS